MKRFILMTFAILAFAWYELSGGADFKAGPTLAAEARTTTPEPAPEPAPAPEVARADIGADTLIKIVPPEPRIDITLAKMTGPAPTTAQSAQVAALAEPAVMTDADPEPVVEAVAAVDMREVTGNRVNLRAGPATRYGVVTQLLRGEQVEVLDAPGNGWVRLRAVDTGYKGWMSSKFLVAVAD